MSRHQQEVLLIFYILISKESWIQVVSLPLFFLHPTTRVCHRTREEGRKRERTCLNSHETVFKESSVQRTKVWHKSIVLDSYTFLFLSFSSLLLFSLHCLQVWFLNWLLHSRIVRLEKDGIECSFEFEKRRKCLFSFHELVIVLFRSASKRLFRLFPVLS